MQLQIAKYSNLQKNDWSYYQLTLKVHNSQNCIEILIVTHYNSLMLIHSSEIPLEKLRKNSNSLYDHNFTMAKKAYATCRNGMMKQIKGFNFFQGEIYVANVKFYGISAVS